MGKVTGFLEIDREQPTRRKAEERINDWFEIYEPFPEEKQREQGARCMDCGVPFCHTGCPVNNLIPDWNDLVYNNRWEAAIRRLHSTNNFPEFTGRICPAPCEAACVLGINQPPVSIKLIERSIVERGWDEGWIHPEPPEQATGKRVAVVGSGPAGLAAAQQLRRAGHSVTVYEKNDRIGGLLRYGIPNFKLEKHVVDRRIAQMKAEGVIFQTNAHVGVNIPVDSLTEQYDAILLCGGAEQPRDLPVPGRELKGIHYAMEFLPQQNRRNEGDNEGKLLAPWAPRPPSSPTASASSSSAAATLARTASAPAIVRAQRASTSLKSCPSRRRSAPHRLRGRSGRCNCAPRARMKKAASATGASTASNSPATSTATSSSFTPFASALRPNSNPSGTEFTLDVDLVLLAMGFLGPVRNGMIEQLGLALDNRGNVATTNYMSSVEGIFAAGDMRRGQSLVVWAISEGRKAAAAVNEYLAKKKNRPHRVSARLPSARANPPPYFPPHTHSLNASAPSFLNAHVYGCQNAPIALVPPPPEP